MKSLEFFLMKLSWLLYNRWFRRLWAFNLSCFCKGFEFHFSGFYFPSWLEVLDHFENLLKEMEFSLGKYMHMRTHTHNSVVRKLMYYVVRSVWKHLCMYLYALLTCAIQDLLFRQPSMDLQGLSPRYPQMTAPGSPVAAKLPLCTGWPLGCHSRHHSKSLWCSLASGQRPSHCSAHFLI